MTGYFYVGQPIPEYNPHRLKVGYSKNPERRKRDYLTANPTFKMLRSWECEPEWEHILIRRLGQSGCGKFVGREVIECDDVASVIRACDGFFEEQRVLTCTKKHSTIPSLGATMKKIIEDAKKPITITVTKEHVCCGVPGDPSGCVLALAWNESMELLGDMFEGVQVGSSITKVNLHGKTIRYATPEKIHHAIPHFDRTGIWELAPGDYIFKPPCPTARLGARPNRWRIRSKNKTQPGQDKWKGRALPTRQVKRATKVRDVRIEDISNGSL